MSFMHGTMAGYGYHKCRCDECRQANARYSRKRKKAIREDAWQPEIRKAVQCTGPECDRVARYLSPQPLCGGHKQQLGRGKELSPIRSYNQVSDGCKRCTRCGEVKPLTEFNRRRQHSTPECKACWSILNRANRYGITADQVRDLIAQPCEGCGSMENLHIDHCHDTGTVRGVLCHNCNTVLTKHMTSTTLRRLADYLDKF